MRGCPPVFWTIARGTWEHSCNDMLAPHDGARDFARNIAFSYNKKTTTIK